MSEFAATQIPKPSDEQAFERCCEVLWRCVLGDDSAHRYGRRGQRQDGVDIVGCRNGDPDRIVGIQCKLKGEGRRLEEREIREEAEKALRFKPCLSEYIIVTTAPDDATFHTLALELSTSLSKGREKNLKVSILGWDSLEREIHRHSEALNAFNPSHTPQQDRLEQRLGSLVSGEVIADLRPKIDTILAAVTTTVVDSSTSQTDWDRRINDHVEIISGHPATALNMFRKIQADFDDSVPDRIRYRVMTNIAVCQLELGEEEIAAQGFIAACDLAPDDPKAVANKAFGLLLRGNWSDLRAFAESRLPEYSNSAVLAACYIHSLIVDGEITDPLAHVPEAVRGTPEVVEANVRWLMDRGDRGAWWDVAIAAHGAHPDNLGLKELCACALLERAIGGDRHFCSQALGKAECEDIQMAIEICEARWSEIRDCFRPMRGEPQAIPINLMTAYRLLNQGGKAIQIGTEALARFPDSDALKEHLAAALVEHGNADRAQELVSEIQDGSQAVVVRYNIAMMNEDWETISALVNQNLEAFPEAERKLACAGQIIAKVELAVAEDRCSILEEEKVNFESDARALAMFAQIARKHGLDDLASEYMTAALQALEHGDDELESRIATAYEAMAQSKHRIVADVLIGRMPLDRHSEGLELLAHALVRDYPIRERAVRFFDSLPSKIRNLPYFQHLEGILHIHRGDPEEGIDSLSTAFNQQPSIENLMQLINAHLRVGSKSAITALLRQNNVDTLPGSASARIEFCHVLLHFGEGARALDLGYQALTEGLEDAGVVKRFLGLIFAVTRCRTEDKFDGVVAFGVWVRLAPSQGEAYEALVGEEIDRPWGAKGDPANVFLSKALGRKVGDEFEHVNSVTGVTETWTIAEVKPRWLRAFHHLTRTFSQRFPDSSGFAHLTMAEGDIEPVLKQVRRYSEWISSIDDLYLNKHLPIAFAAGDRPGGSITFAQHLATIGKDLRVCSGTEEERTEALLLIKKHNRAGAVLDALTAWHAAILDIFSVLSERLGPLAVPVSELYVLKAMVEHHEAMAGQETMSLAYQDGQYIQYVLTEEEHAEQLALMKSRVVAIENACNIETLVVPDNLSELGEALVHPPFGDAVAPAIIAGQTRLLLSEDMVMRQVVDKAYGTKGVWMQAVMWSAVQAKTISPDVYVDALVHLATHRHGYVRVNAQVLFLGYERDTSDELVRLQALCTYLGNEKAELVSNITVAADFINMIWAEGSSAGPKIRTATDLVFRVLLQRDREPSEQARWVDALYVRLDEPPKDYFRNWCEEQSLAISDIG